MSDPVREALAEWEDPRVQIVYRLLVDDTAPPNSEEHWEGWVARRVVAALAQEPAMLDVQQFAYPQPKSPPAAAAEGDAQRYRWLRDNCFESFHDKQYPGYNFRCTVLLRPSEGSPTLDAAIDAVRGAK